jgi:hypothetical protein
MNENWIDEKRRGLETALQHFNDAKRTIREYGAGMQSLFFGRGREYQQGYEGL